MGWTIDVASTTAVTGPDGPVDLRTKERAIVAGIALHHPSPVSAATLVPLVWGDQPPTTAVKSVHNHVSRLRRSLPRLVTTDEHGYRFDPDVSIESGGSPTSYADLVEHPQVVASRARARSDALHAEEREIIGEIRSQATDELRDRLDVMVRQAPQRLIRWWWLAVITARLGRRREALDVLRRSRRWHDTTIMSPDARAAINRLEQAIASDDVFIDSPVAVDVPIGGDAVDPSALPSARLDDLGAGIIDPTGVIGELIEAIDGGRSSTVIVAPPGGGKSSAVRAVVERLPARGWTCVSASCSPVATNPLQPILDLCEQRRAIEPRARPTGPDADRPRPVGDEATSLLEAVTTPSARRVLLVVDDAHDAGEVGQHYLTRLAEIVGAHDGRVAVLFASRDESLTPHVDAEVELPPWDEAAVAHFLGTCISPGRWQQGAAEWVARISGGNPLAARELVLEALRDAPDDPQIGEFRPPTNAATNGDLAARRVERLLPTTVSVLCTAAVLGDRFRRDDLARLEQDAGAALAAAEARGLIADVDDETSRFTHQTFRQALLDHLSDAELMSISHRVARVIDRSVDRDQRLGELAHFARRAASHDPERAITTTLDEIAAAHRARRYDEVLTLSRLALRLIEEHEDRSTRWCEVAVVAGQIGIHVGAADAVDVLAAAGTRAVELGADDLVADVVWGLCALNPITSVGSIGELQGRLLDHALDHVTDPQRRARVCAAGSFAWALADDACRSRQLFDEADELSAAADDEEARGDVLLRSFPPLAGPGDVPRRRRIAAELHELGRRLDRIEYEYEAHRLDFADAIHWGTGDPRPTMRRIEEIATVLDQQGRNWSLTSFRATVGLLDGDLDAAEAHANHLLSDDVTASPQLVLSTYGAHLLSIRIVQDRVDELDQLIADLSAEQPELMIWRAVRCLTAARHDPATARSAFDAAVVDGTHVLPRNFAMLPGLVALGEGAWRLGDAERMTAIAELLTEFEDRWAWFSVGTVGPVDLTLARLLASLGRHEEAADATRRGLRSTSRVGAPLFAAQLARLLDGLGT